MMATKKNELKQGVLFTKEQILASDKYANKKDVCNTVIPENFNGTLNEVDVLIENFMKGKVK
jgi:hypothetical protein